MTAALGQDKRRASLNTPLGKDVLGLTRFQGGEGLSELFEFRIEAVSLRQNIDFTPAIGRNCHVEFAASKSTKRFFNGVLVEAQWIGVRDHDYAYQLVLRPWLWLLSHSATCRIFRDMNAPDIIEKVFKDAGFPDFRRKLFETYPVMEYCVQYRETNLAFVSRLMEQYGIYHYFEHTEDKHTLVLADCTASHANVPGAPLPYNPIVDAFLDEREHIYHWMPERRFRTGKVDLVDYDYLQSNAKLLAEDQASEGYNKCDLKVYDFPGKYPRKDPNACKNTGDGDRLAKIRLQAEQALDQRRHAAGHAGSIYPGGLFDLKDHPCDGENQKYLVVRATHSFAAQQYRSGDLGGNEGYYGHYEVLPSTRPYRAPLVTPKPVIQGPQTAKVVDKDGKGGEGKDKSGKEIDVDEHGRIHLRFHWDLEEKGRSRPVRVAQVWSGKQWGGQFIPRIGMEVVVQFLEGDPDRPLVIGTVYNEKYKYPYELPSLQTRSGIKSDSFDTGPDHFNEIYFEDQKGGEVLYMQAEKDHEVLVKHDETRNIRNDLATAIDNNETRTVGKDQTITVGQNITIEAGTQILLKVGQSTITMTQGGIVISAIKTDVKASTILTINGKLVQIN